jgi:hypothetical protein
VPFHVEIKASSLRHARAFNLSAEELRVQILEPWLAGRPVDLGEQEWVPRESSLTILEGPRLEPADLAFGQGWANAERASQSVTAEVLAEAERSAPPAPAYAVRADSLEEALAGGAEAVPIDLDAAREAIDRRDQEIAAVVLVTRPQSAAERE